MTKSFQATIRFRATDRDPDPRAIEELLRSWLEASPIDARLTLIDVSDVKPDPYHGIHIHRGNTTEPSGVIRPGDHPADWGPIKRAEDFVQITEEPPKFEAMIMGEPPPPRPTSRPDLWGRDFGPMPPATPVIVDKPRRGPPATPFTPEKCPLRCVDCDGEDHHWMTEIENGYADDEPDHPAAVAGLEVWDICKHCPAWKPTDAAEWETDEDDDEPRPPRCQYRRCRATADLIVKGVRFTVMRNVSGFELDEASHEKLCLNHAIAIGRTALERWNKVPGIEYFAPSTAEMISKYMERLIAVPVAMILFCPRCTAQHVDLDEWAVIPHRTHRCVHCRFEWRPKHAGSETLIDGCTVGVSALPDHEA